MKSLSLSYFDLSVLRDLSELQVLYISGINGATFGEGFKSLINLSVLQLLPCDIREFKNDTFINRKTPLGNESLVSLFKFKSSFFSLTIPENASTSM
jgi:hypothetical protein